MRCRTNADGGTDVSLQSALVMAALSLVVGLLVAWAFATAAFSVPLLRARVVILLAAIPPGVYVHPFGRRDDAEPGGGRVDAPVVRRRRCRA